MGTPKQSHLEGVDSKSDDSGGVRYRDEWLVVAKVVRNNVSSTPRVDEGTVWRKPVGNILKCNCDVAIFERVVWVVFYVTAMMIS